MQTKPNVILILMDTVRADHLSCYGHQRKTTPNIDEVARHSVVYENAFTAAPWTPPAHASIFTGKYPSRHRILGRNVRFNGTNIPLAKSLSQRGYQTVGIPCCPLLQSGSGFEKGFQEFLEPEPLSLGSRMNFKLSGLYLKNSVRTAIQGPDKGTYHATELAMRFLRRRRRWDRPFFLFINYFNCHTPYDPPRPFKKRFCKDFSRSRFYVKEFLSDKILHRTTEKTSDHNLSSQRLRWIASGLGGFAFSAKKTHILEKEWDVVKSWYDGEIAYLDHQMGILFEFLRDAELFDDTLLIITSDHGENFGEHGLAVHPLCLYDVVLHVPLIISFPNLPQEGRRIKSLVSTVDIFPTVMDICNIEFQDGIQGKSLHPFTDRRIHDFICAEYGGLHRRSLPGWEGRLLRYNIELGKIDKGCKCLRSLNYKYILTGGKEELYDLRVDRYELKNIVAEHPKLASASRKQLEKTVDISYFGPKELPQGARQRALERLKALGYI